MGSMPQTRESTTTTTALSMARAGRTTVADTISHTIAKLLSFIPDDTLYPCIIFDLVHLLVDLSVVAQTGLLLHDQQTTRHKNVKGATKNKKKKRKKLQVVILSDTVGQSPLAADYNDNTEAVFVLDITSINVLSSLQAATFSILQQFLMDLQLRRIQPLPVTMMVDPAMCNRPPVEGAEPSKAPLFQPVGNVDLLFYGVLEDGELLSMLFLGLRQVLQSSVVVSCSGTKTQQHPLLCLYSKITAARLLIQLVQDLHKDGVPTLKTAIEVAILICNAVKIFLQDDISVTGISSVGITGLSASDVSNYEEMSQEYLQLLTTLVRDTILFPPNVHGASSVAEVLWTMRSATFTTLLDCLALIAEKVATPGIGTSRTGHGNNSDRDPLYAILFQAVHAFRFTPPTQHGTATKPNSSAAESMIWTYCASHGISRHLFVILQHHANLAELIVGLLSWLLDPFYNPMPSMAPMTDWNNACLQALDQHTNNTTNASASLFAPLEGRTSTSTIVPPPPPKTNPMIVNKDSVDVAVTPKVVGGSGVKRKKLMSASPQKQKGSPFQPKSLTFEASSPLKKRRRSSVPAATASSGLQVETGLGLFGAPIVWQDALCGFLVAALDASNRLGDSFLKPLAGTFVDERATGYAPPESEDESTTDSNMTLNGIRLLLSMLQHRRAGATVQRDEVDLEAPLKVLCSLAGKLQTCCESIEAVTLENGSLASLQQCVCDAAITCGLHAQFTVEVSLRRWTSNNAAQLRKTFDYFSGLGARLCMTKLLSTQHSSKLKVPSSRIPSTRSCSNLCTGVNSAFAILADHGSSDRSKERSPHSWMCPFIFPDGLAEPSEWSTNSNLLATQARNCYSMCIISTLPLRTRCVVSCTTGFPQYQCSLFSF
jgi:hypothetical protein